MSTDLSKLSDDDLLALKAGDLSKVSTEGLLTLRGASAPAGVDATVQRGQPERNNRLRSINPFGLPEAALSMGSAMVAQPLAGLAGLAGAVMPGEPGQGADWVKAVQQAMTYQPRSKTGQKIIGEIGGLAESVGNIPLVKQIGQDIDLLGEKSPASGAFFKALPEAAMLMLAKKPMTKGAENIVNSLAPRVEPETARLMRVAADNNMPMRPDMLFDSKLGKTLGNFLEKDIPFAGGKKALREEALTKGVIKTINPESTAARLTDEVYVAALDRSGGAIAEIAARNPLRATSELTRATKTAVKEASDYSGDIARLVKARNRDLSNLVDNGVIDGTAFRRWNSKMLQDMRSAGDGTTRTALSKLQEAAMDAFEASMSPSDLRLWKTARKEYATAKQLMPTVAASPAGLVDTQMLRASFGNMSAKERLAMGKAGELGDLYKISQRFMKDPPGATLPERIATYGVLGAAGAGAGVASGSIVPAMVAGGIYGTANLYNRLGPAAARYLSKQRQPASSISLAEGIPIGAGLFKAPEEYLNK